uniref:Glycosyltransferase RgtA/B/C/D-like domain-containing protein n=1 Tax=candidate division WOR-3 bacterium TaxID=2052148 RepID=A0A7C3N6V6_UNCW3
MKRFENLLIFFIFFILFTLLEIPFMDSIPKVWVDEVWYAGTSYNFSKGLGFTNQNVIGLYGGDYLFGYSLALGTFYKIFGCNLFLSKFFSYILGVLFLILFFFISKELSFGVKEKIFFLLFFIFSSTVFLVYRTVRPEALKILFSSLSLFFLLKGLKGEEKFFILSTFFSLCGVLTHPDEIFFTFIFFFIIVFYSIKNKNIKPLFFFLSVVIICSILFLFFLYFVKKSSIGEFYLLYGRRLSVYEGSLFGQILFKLKNLYNDYALGFKRLYIFLFEIFVFIFGLIFFRKDNKIKLLSFIGLSYFILGFLFMERFVTRGFISIIFYSILVLTLILKNIQEKWKVLFFVLSFLYLINNVVAIAYLLYRDRDVTSYSKIENYCEKNVEKGKVVLSNIIFYFPFKDNRFYNDYTYYKLTKFKTLDSLIKSDSVDYIVISDYLTKGVTSVSNKKEKEGSLKIFKIFYSKVKNYADSFFVQYDSLKTTGYGTLKFYKKKLTR